MRLTIIALASFGCISLMDGAYIHAKAILAQYLIADAWSKSVDAFPSAIDEHIKPWGWADTWPVARLKFQNGQDLVVLAGAQGNSLAFGPGHLTGTALPGEPGASVVAGHRDTHFSFLGQMAPGHNFMVQNRAGTWTRYTVSETQVTDTTDQPNWWIAPVVNQLQLVTCYPFNAINPGGPLRFVVTAVPTPTVKPRNM